VRRPLAIARQASAPSGLFGRLLLRIMARGTTPLNLEVLDALRIADGDRVLEVGFGHGKTLATAAASTPTATFAGIDVSADAVRVASRRCRNEIAAGRMELQLGDARALPWADASFAKAFTVHTIYFWSDPIACLRELRRVVRPGGRLIVGFCERSPEVEAAFPPAIYHLYSGDEVIEMLRGAGFVAELRRADSADDLRLAVAAR
jgi:ubiquinone/menaquinone biosynthesis C-methylase UbiE